MYIERERCMHVYTYIYIYICIYIYTNCNVTCKHRRGVLDFCEEDLPLELELLLGPGLPRRLRSDRLIIIVIIIIATIILVIILIHV